MDELLFLTSVESLPEILECSTLAGAFGVSWGNEEIDTENQP